MSAMALQANWQRRSPLPAAAPSSRAALMSREPLWPPRARASSRAKAHLAIQVTQIGGHEVTTSAYVKEEKGKGKRTTGMIGGGAGAGALIGGLAGGGKGAAIGALVGAGAGTAGAALYRKQGHRHSGGVGRHVQAGCSGDRYQVAHSSIELEALACAGAFFLVWRIDWSHAAATGLSSLRHRRLALPSRVEDSWSA